MCQILDMDIVKLLSKKKKYELSHFGLDICVYGYIWIYYGYILIFVKYWIWIWQIYWGWKSMSNCCIWVSSPPSSLYPTLKSASQRISKDCKDNLNLSIKLQSVQHPSITDFIPQPELGTLSTKKNGIFWEFFPSVGPPLPPFWEKFPKNTVFFLVGVTKGWFFEKI